MFGCAVYYPAKNLRVVLKEQDGKILNVTIESMDKRMIVDTKQLKLP